MRVQLFGVGTKSQSPAITAQRRINCYVDVRQEADRTQFALIGRPGLKTFADLGAFPSRGMWPVNTLSTPLLFTVHNMTLYSIDNAGNVAVIGMIGSTLSDVSMADDGRYLMLVDGVNGYYYNLLAPAGLNQIVSGNFTTTPKTVTWQDTYFIVTSGANNQFQLSANGDPTTWPAVNINFTGTQGGALQAGISDHSILNLFGDVYSEFWQNTGAPDFPFAFIPGSSQEFGIAAPFSLSKYDNSIVGLFKNKMGGVNVSRLSGFSIRRLSTTDIENILAPISSVINAQGYALMISGHPMYVINLPSAGVTLMYDGIANVWSELQSYGHTHFNGLKFANFFNRLLVAAHHNGQIWEFDDTVYTDIDSPLSMEVWSKHIWQDDKYIGISQLQVDIESGIGTAGGQGVNPVVDLQVSKDGGKSFFSVGYSGMGKIGEYTQRVVWRSLGAARDWVLKLVITDPVKRVITGASAEITGASF